MTFRLDGLIKILFFFFDTSSSFKNITRMFVRVDRKTFESCESDKLE